MSENSNKSESEIIFTGPGGQPIENEAKMDPQKAAFENCFYSRFQMVPEEQRKELCEKYVS